MFKINADEKREKVEIMTEENKSLRQKIIDLDDEGKRLGGAPTIVVTLSGEAYNLFYAEWNSESLLYSSVTSLIDAHTSGASISGLTTS